MTNVTMLRIAEGFELPLKFVVSTQAILAKKRVGKSYTADIQAEELLEAGQHLVIIDPTGAHWGLRASADGMRPGYPIAILGGDHADVPLEPSAGSEVADAIVGDRFSAILDLSLMETSEANRFAGDFLRRIYKINRLPFHVFIDEADMFAPQQPMGEESRTCGAVNTLVRRGGIKGIGCTLITQRPAVLSKSVLSQVDMLTCLRIHHPLDLKQISDWVGVHARGDTAAVMLESLPSLPKGEVWVWNPEIDLFRRVKMRRKRTFDSGATPEPGEAVPAPRVLADIDLGKLGDAIRDSMQRAIDSDPKALREDNARLRRELEALRAAPPVVSRAAELEALRDTVSQAVLLLGDGLAAAGAPLVPVLETPAAIVRQRKEAREQPTIAAAPPPPRPASRKAAALPEVDGLAPRHVTILAGLRWWESVGVDAPTFVQVAFHTDYAASSRGFKEPVGELGTRGLVVKPGDGTLRLTDAGRALAPVPELRSSGTALRDLVFERLAPRHAALLGPLLAKYPEWVDDTELARATGYEPTSRGFKEPRGELKTLGIVESSKGRSRATDLLFPTKRRR